MHGLILYKHKSFELELRLEMLIKIIELIGIWIIIVLIVEFKD